MFGAQNSAYLKVNISKQKKGDSSQAAPCRLDTWFIEEKWKLDYIGIFGNKNIIVPKYLNLQWFKNKGFQFPTLLEYQGLAQLVQMSGKFYPELVKVFYTIVRANMDGLLYATFSSKEMVIDDDVWESVAGITNIGIQKFDESLDGYSKMSTYRSMLLDPTVCLRNRLGVGGLMVKDRMLEYIVIYVLTQEQGLMLRSQMTTFNSFMALRHVRK